MKSMVRAQAEVEEEEERAERGEARISEQAVRSQVQGYRVTQLT